MKLNKAKAYELKLIFTVFMTACKQKGIDL